MASISDRLLAEAGALDRACAGLAFGPPVWGVYNAFGYALPGYAAYVRRYGTGRKRVLYLGMNPGPWGMAQTGVPFGEVAAVRGWLGIEATIGKPPREHPKRPVQGFACPKSEMSGRRLWGLFADLYGTPGAFFAESFVLNYCPLAFLLESGANLTPDKLAAAERAPLEAACDAHLRAVITLLEPELVVGVGAWATQCVERLAIPGLRTGTMLHPSPASPAANRGWPQVPAAQLRALL